MSKQTVPTLDPFKNETLEQYRARVFYVAFKYDQPIEFIFDCMNCSRDWFGSGAGDTEEVGDE